ncbi:MAG TPA: pyridoxal-dependent decarboxylase [Kineosporiaceae bacterium]
MSGWFDDGDDDRPWRPPQGVGAVWGDEGPLARAVLDWASNRAIRTGDPKTSARPASELARLVGKTVTPSGIGGHGALALFADVLAAATRSQDDPMNLAYIPSAPTRAAVAFDAATSAANIFGGLWETGAGAIFAENEALDWLISLTGWPTSAAGVFVAGGTVGNLSALHAARSAARSRRSRRGLPARPSGGWRLACAQSAHSSIRSAADVLDVEVLLVPVDAQGRLTGAALRSALQGVEGTFAVVASAGSTNEGIVDDLASIVDVCVEHELWLHVDGAYGGAALCAPSVRARFAGIERADSLIVDPHKWLFAPYDCCALVYRDGALARAAHTQTATYLDVVDREAPNPADLAIHLSRRARGLPFWFSLATHGTDRYVHAVERTLATAHEVAEGIRRSPHLVLVLEPDLTVILFERPGWTAEQYHAWSRAEALAGTILCLPTEYHGRTVLRLAFVNPATRAGDVLAVLDAMGG